MAILRHMESMNMKPTNTKKDTTTITKGMTMNMRDMIMNMKRPEKDMPVKFRLKKHWQEAVGLQTSKVEPGVFTDVIKTSGRVMAAQGEESTVVATVPGVVTFGNLSFVDGTAVRKGQAILSLASSSLSDGNVAAKAKYAYENAKKEYERMETLIGDKIVSAKDFEQARLNYENAKVAWEAVAGKQTANGVSVVSPINGYLKNLQVKEGVM